MSPQNELAIFTDTEIAFKESIRYPLLLMYMERRWIKGSKEQLDRIVQLVLSFQHEKATIRLRGQEIKSEKVAQSINNLDWHQVAYALDWLAKHEDIPSDSETLAFLFYAVSQPYCAEQFRDMFCKKYPRIFQEADIPCCDEPESCFKKNIAYPILLRYIQQGWLCASKKQLARIVQLILDTQNSKPEIVLSDRTVWGEEVALYVFNLDWYQIAYAADWLAMRDRAVPDTELLTFLYETYVHPYQSYMFCYDFCKKHKI